MPSLMLWLPALRLAPQPPEAGLTGLALQHWCPLILVLPLHPDHEHLVASPTLFPVLRFQISEFLLTICFTCFKKASLFLSTGVFWVMLYVCVSDMTFIFKFLSCGFLCGCGHDCPGGNPVLARLFTSLVSRENLQLLHSFTPERYC